MSSQTSEKIHPLTSLRFFAAMYVVIYHTLGNLVVGKFVPGYVEIPLPSEALPHFANRLLSLGFISVSFFFLLSGYILAVVYLRRGPTVGKRKFFLARFARIYPLSLIALLIDTPLAFYNLLGISGVVHAVVKTGLVFGVAATMLQAWILKYRGINNPSWSLSVETLFYLSFPFIGPFLWRLRGVARLLAILVIYTGGQTVIWLVTPHVSHLTAIFNPLLHLSTFMLGILLASWQFNRPQVRSSRPWHSYLVLGTALTAFAVTVQMCGRIPLTGLKDGILAPIFMGIIWALSSSDNAVSKAFSAGWLVTLGEASFALYLLHIPVLHVFELFHSIANPAFYALYLALTIGLSLLSLHYVEGPCRRWILERFQSRSRESVETSSIAQ
jgi:peptidoglycan/LPS O-acetylase OafA/YrhL